MTKLTAEVFNDEDDHIWASASLASSFPSSHFPSSLSPIHNFGRYFADARLHSFAIAYSNQLLTLQLVRNSTHQQQQQKQQQQSGSTATFFVRHHEMIVDMGVAAQPTIDLQKGSGYERCLYLAEDRYSAVTCGQRMDRTPCKAKAICDLEKCGRGSCFVELEENRFGKLLPSSFLCKCGAGFTGSNCEIATNVRPTPCVGKDGRDVCGAAEGRGVCRKADPAEDDVGVIRVEAICDCKFPFYGKFCEGRVKESICKERRPCENGGRCWETNGGRDFRCVCRKGQRERERVRESERVRE